MLTTTSISTFVPTTTPLPGFPRFSLKWPLSDDSVHESVDNEKALAHAVDTKAFKKGWVFPKRPILFIADAHADADAFYASLLATGGIEITGKKRKRLCLTNFGRSAVFVIGGDCLDKGPSNLALLRAVKQLIDTGARVKILAGNHDLRLLMGILVIGEKRETGSEHMFVRMGRKVVPLLAEVFDEYLRASKWSKGIPGEKECRRRLFPADDWFEAFPAVAISNITPEGISRELKKMRSKVQKFEQYCEESGLSMRQVYAVALKCKSLFLSEKGEFGWFFHSMQLAYKKGSFLFVHAGLDDKICQDIAENGISQMNKRFHQQLNQNLFGFYYSSLANTFRTKYRLADKPLTSAGVSRVKEAGIYALVRGHVSHLQGQKLSIREGLLHIEGDVTLDRNSRRKGGAVGIGYGVTVIEPAGFVVAISADYPYAKVFNPKHYSLKNCASAHH